MLTETTVNKLNEMKLTTMARAFKEQLITPNISELSFEDRFGLLVDQEWTSRKNNHLKKLIKRAKFAEYDANVEDIEYSISTDSIETTMTGTRVSTSGIVTLGTFNDNTANSAKVTIILTGKTTEISKKIMITVTKPLPAKDVLPNPTNDATSPYVNYVVSNY